MDFSVPIRRLVMVGACYVDTILSVPYFPTEDHKLRASCLCRRRGGNVANSLEVLQQFDVADNVELILLCVLPSQAAPATSFIRDSLGPRVNTSYCICREQHSQPASSYIIKTEDSGSRTIVNYNELPEMTLDEFKQQVSLIGAQNTEKRTWFHFEGREVETSIACLKWLREEMPDPLLSVEVEKPNRPGLERLAEQANVVFYSKTWAQAAGHDSAESLLRVQAAILHTTSLLCCTWGADGAAVAGLGGKFLVQGRSADMKSPVVDTIGAGDTWTAGALCTLLSWDGGGGLEECARQALYFANRLAARKVAQKGFGRLGLETDT